MIALVWLIKLIKAISLLFIILPPNILINFSKHYSQYKIFKNAIRAPFKFFVLGVLGQARATCKATIK